MLEQQEEQEPNPPETNVAAIAILGLMVGLILWVGGACLVLGSGGSGDLVPQVTPRTVSTPGVSSPTPGRLADRTSCDEIRGTDYRSEAERRWFLANCS